MAWALAFDGSNDFATLASDPARTATEWRIEFRMRNNNTTNNPPSTNVRVLGNVGNLNDSILINWTGTSDNVTYRLNAVNYAFSQSPAVTNDQDFHDYVITANGTQLECFIDTVSLGTVAGSPTFEDFECFGRSGTQNAWMDLEYFRYYETSGGDTLVFNWSADDSSHAAGTPVLTETVSSNDATGVNMPTDGSAWVNLSTGITVTGQTPQFDFSAVNALIELTGAIDITGTTTQFDFSPIAAVINTTSQIQGNTAQFDFSPVNADITTTNSIEGQVTQFDFSPVNSIVTTSFNIEGNTPQYLFTAVNGQVDIVGETNITGQTPAFDFAAQNAIIQLAGEINIQGQTPSYSFTPIAGDITVTSGIVGQVPNYAFTAINATIDLTGEISVTGQNTEYSFSPQNAQITLQGAYDINGQTLQYDFTATNAKINLITGKIIDLSGLAMSYGDDGININYTDDGITINYR